MQLRLLAALLPSVVLVGGCIQSAAVLRVNADGSGTLENRAVMTPAALAQVRQLTGAFGGDAKPLDPFSEEQARAAAARMGEGVTLVSSTAISSPAGEGRTSVYGFGDITKLRVSQGPDTPGGAGGAAVGGAAGGTLSIELTRTPAGNMLLTLHTPGDPLSALFDQVGALSRPGTPIPPDQMAMVRQMMAGMHMSLVVEPAGRLVRTNSPFVNGQTVTLFDVDLDALLADPAAFAKLQNAKTAAETAAALLNAPGVKLTRERDITIEFAP